MVTDHPVIREIITRAVCGKGSYNYQRSIDLEVPIRQKTVQVLGNFISNAVLDEATVMDYSRNGKAVQVKGRYDVHVWYAYDQETCAAKTTVSFIEYIPIQLISDAVVSDLQAVAEILEKPRCRKAYVKDLDEKSVIRIEIEQLLSAEVIGLTKVKVGIAPSTAIPLTPYMGRELLPPQSRGPDTLETGCYLDLKCEEDLPEDDEDYEYGQDEYKF